MTRFRLIIGSVLGVALLLGIAAPAASASAASPPVCEKVHVWENSTEGPNYYVTLCGNRALPIHTIIVDGSKLPERTEVGTRPKAVLFWDRQPSASLIHTTAVARIPGPCDQGTVHYSIGIQPGSLSSWWNPDSDSSTTDGCAALWSQVKDNQGNVKTGGRVYYDNGVKSGATAPDGGSIRWAKIWMFINGACQFKTVFSPSGVGPWTLAACP